MKFIAIWTLVFTVGGWAADVVIFGRLSDAFESSLEKYDFNSVPGNDGIQLFDINGQNNYENIIVSPGEEKKLAIGSTDMLKFTSNGGNLILISEGATQLDCTLFLNELGIYPAPKGYRYVDHHETRPLVSQNHRITDKEVGIDENTAVSLVSNSEYIIPLYQTSRTSMSVNDGGEYWHSGNGGYAAVAFQGLNNGRVLWIGSPSIADTISEDTIEWTFQLRNVIRITKVSHVRESGPFVDVDDYYKVGDKAIFEMDMQEFNYKKGWVPYVASDVQLDFVMLDPYQRVTLNSTKEGRYSTILHIPDQHGMFTFNIDYKRPGLSYVSSQIVVPVRHLANDEYERSWEIPNARVYLTGNTVVIAAWFVFILLWVVSK